MVTYALYGAVIVIVLVVLFFGGRAILDAARQKRVTGAAKTYPLKD
jgi:hypothetical protein